MDEVNGGDSQRGDRSLEAIEQEEKTNYFRVCRIVVDNISNLLRYLIYDLSKDSLDNFFAAKVSLFPTQVQLVKNEGINKWDTSLLAKMILSEGHTIFMERYSASISQDCYENKYNKKKKREEFKVDKLNSISNDFQFDEGSNIYLEVSEEKKAKVKMCTPTRVTFENSITLTELPNEEITIYYCGNRWQALFRLKQIRNDDYGHMAKCQISSKDYEEIVQKVKAAYKTLGAPVHIRDELEKILSEEYNVNKFDEKNDQWRKEIVLTQKYEKAQVSRKRLPQHLDESGLTKHSRIDSSSPTCSAHSVPKPGEHSSSSSNDSDVPDGPIGSQHKQVSPPSSALPMPEPTAGDPSLGQSIEKIEKNFFKLAKRLLTILNKKTDVEEVIGWISLLPPSVNIYVYDMWKDICNEVHDRKSLFSLFSTLNQSVWNILDYHLLEFLIQECGDQELKKDMHQYIDELENFKQTTYVVDFIEHWKGHCREFPNFKEFKMKFEDVKHMTLKILENCRDEMKKNIFPSLREFSGWMYYSNFEGGCFIVSWQLPEQLALLIRVHIRSLHHLLIKYGVVEVIVGDEVVYNKHTSSYRDRSYSLPNITALLEKPCVAVSQANRSYSLPNITALLETHTVAISKTMSTGRIATDGPPSTTGGPLSTTVSTKLDILKVTEETFSARAKWYFLGLTLGISNGTLEAIERGVGNIDDRHRAMLTKWLDGEGKEISWSTLIEALRNKIVSQKSLADELARKYL